MFSLLSAGEAIDLSAGRKIEQVLSRLKVQNYQNEKYFNITCFARTYCHFEMFSGHIRYIR